MIVDIALTRDQDNPQLIFESMNSTGRELSQADLIRNFVLMGLERIPQTRLYQDYWGPMEVAFGQKAYSKHFDGFMRHYLTLRTGEIPNVRAVYEAFKAHANSPEVAAAGVEALVAEVHAYAGHYCAMALDQETDKEPLAFRAPVISRLTWPSAFLLAISVISRLTWPSRSYSRFCITITSMTFSARVISLVRCG